MLLLGDGTEVADVLDPYRRPRRARPERPCWVVANMVGGLDGCAAIGGRVGSLSEGADVELFGALRSLADVVLVGAETVRRERYGPVRLSAEHQDERRATGRTPLPPIAVVSRSLNLDWDSPLFASVDGPRPIVVTCGSADTEARRCAEAHAEVVVAGEATVDLASALATLRGLGHEVVLCEGGPTLLGELASFGLLDELCLSVAPRMGGDPLPLAVTPAGGAPTHLRLRHVARDGDTLLLRYEVDDHG